MSLKKLAQGFKYNGACKNRTRIVRVENQVHTNYTTGLRQSHHRVEVTLSSSNEDVKDTLLPPHQHCASTYLI